ncbi:MAG: hypothetical protein K2M04_03315 [Muribaculaceae bacterium]|nr:hypothetical protein [Muribaculaceae bacterium]
MNIKYLIYIVLSLALLASSCSDSPISGDPDDVDNISGLAISYVTDYYGAGLSRTPSEETLCWSDWNEKIVTDLDFYLLDADGKITFRYNTNEETDECGVPHTILEFKEDGTSPIGLTFEMLNEASRIAIVANYPVTGEVIGSRFDDVYAQILTGLIPDKMQDYFVMAGYFDLPDQISRYTNIMIPIRRIAAKIRLTLKNPDGTYVPAQNFTSILCRYVTTARIPAEPLMPEFLSSAVASPIAIYPAAQAEPEGPCAGADWQYPDDLIDAHDLVRDGGHVYYSYPADWIDYTKVTNSCIRTGNTGHNDSDHNNGLRYEITDLDDTPPILAEREVFLIIKAAYMGKQYFYKVPVNYRVSDINDQQCFSRDDLTGNVFALYRLQRNHFYDIVALIDREGAPTPQQAIDPLFILNVAPLTHGGTFDYIYD